MSELSTYIISGAFELESGESIQDAHIAYEIFCSPNDDNSNVVFVGHALTGNTKVTEWWGGLIGEGTSPGKTIRLRFDAGSTTGTAESNACV